MRFFVTGGAGFIGSNFIEFLFKEYPGLDQVTVYDALTYAGKKKNVQNFFDDKRFNFIQGNILDRAFLQDSMKNHDYVIHFAAESHVDRSIVDGGIFAETNVTGSYNVFSAALANEIKTVVHVSTDEVYGSLARGSANEDHPIKPNSPYAASKASSDLIARSMFMTHSLDIRITRCCNNFGPNQDLEKLIPMTINRVMHDQDIPIYGDGTNIREWIQVSDHCRAIATVLFHGNPGEIYNIGTGIEISNLDLVTIIRDMFPSSKSLVKFVADRKGHDFRYSLNSDKIRNLGYYPKFELQSSLRNLVDQILNDIQGSSLLKEATDHE